MAKNIQRKFDIQKYSLNSLMLGSSSRTLFTSASYQINNTRHSTVTPYYIGTLSYVFTDPEFFGTTNCQGFLDYWKTTLKKGTLPFSIVSSGTLATTNYTLLQLPSGYYRCKIDGDIIIVYNNAQWQVNFNAIFYANTPSILTEIASDQTMAITENTQQTEELENTEEIFDLLGELYDVNLEEGDTTNVNRQ